jgi:hypothetical protein
LRAQEGIFTDMKIAFGFLLALFASLPQEKSIDSLLDNPFDLQKFKKTKGPSNSGLADVQPYYHQPTEKGRFFYFFMFRAMRTFRYSGDQKIAVRGGSGFQITTYKPDGKYKDDYFDPTEKLIEVVASYNDEDLPELALVGLDTAIIKERFGNNFIRRDSCFVYMKNSNALVLKIRGGAVACLKYAKLKSSFTEATLPKALTNMPCEHRPLR